MRLLFTGSHFYPPRVYHRPGTDLGPHTRNGGKLQDSNLSTAQGKVWVKVIWTVPISNKLVYEGCPLFLYIPFSPYRVLQFTCPKMVMILQQKLIEWIGMCD